MSVSERFEKPIPDAMVLRAFSQAADSSEILMTIFDIVNSESTEEQRYLYHLPIHGIRNFS